MVIVYLRDGRRRYVMQAIRVERPAQANGQASGAELRCLDQDGQVVDRFAFADVIAWHAQ